MWKYLLLVATLGWGAHSWWAARPVWHGPGMIAPHAPVQAAVSEARPFDHKGYRITPLARFSLEARVLRREDYRLGRESDISPIDLAFGWGRMSDEAVLSRIEISQSNRFYYWRLQEFPIPRREIETSSANMHLIPASSAVERSLKKVREGQVVRLDGYLVRVDAADGWQWISSLSREDTGAGSCELIWVSEAQTL